MDCSGKIPLKTILASLRCLREWSASLNSSSTRRSAQVFDGWMLSGDK